MGVVRVDDELLSIIKRELKKEENKYKYGSLSSYINYMLHKQLNNKIVKNK